MDKKRVVIVDDSDFSVLIIKDILEKNGFEVVGHAGSLEEVISVVSETKPDLVTMDITLPGTNGFECTKEIRKIDNNIKIVIVSSMMDDEMLKKAKDYDVNGYVQKPIDEEEFILTIQRLIDDEELFKYFKNLYVPVFKEAFSDALNKMTKTIAKYKDEHLSSETMQSKGIAVVIGIIGKYSGRMILDMSIETATDLSNKMLKRECKQANEIIATIGEFANIISGNACSMLNRENKVFGLRVSPPSVFYGKSLNISSANFKTSSIIIDTEFGEMLLNIGFSRGDSEWMQNM
ncbi:response regulator [Tepidanaerobacter acetatoxydans]|uniref:response regulator n=1 Tax=Tepidanaerobacter acetatoxydans TaxID=499229 RepID=UPI001BD23EAB